MLRNWSERIPAGSPEAGALVSGTPYVGLLGSEILAATASGDHGSGLFVPWSVEPSKRYRPLVTGLTGADLDLNEDGSGVGYGPFSATLSVYEDNLLVSDSITVTGAIGAQIDVAVAASVVHAVQAAAAVSAARLVVDVDVAGLVTHSVQAAASMYVGALVYERPPQPLAVGRQRRALGNVLKEL